MANKPDSNSSFLINDVSRQVGLSQKRIREYEKAGLIHPRREPRTNNRRYTEAEVSQILRIKDLIHEHGFTLACLKQFLKVVPCWTVFDCQEKAICPTYATPHTPCYEVAEKVTGHPSSKACSVCPIFLNRGEKPVKLMNKT